MVMQWFMLLVLVAIIVSLLQWAIIDFKQQALIQHILEIGDVEDWTSIDIKFHILYN